MTGVARVLIFSGAGRYADPWHPFEETTAASHSLTREASELMRLVQAFRLSEEARRKAA